MYAHSMEEERVDGYQLLAEAIIEQAAEDYASLYPLNARSQAEFNFLDAKKYAPVRRTILRKLCNGAVRSVVEYDICYEAFEKRRRYNMIEQGVYWQ